MQLYVKLKKEHDLGHTFKKVVTKREGVENYGGMSETSTEGTTHTIGIEEEDAFTNWINRFVKRMGGEGAGQGGEEG